MWIQTTNYLFIVVQKQTIQQLINVNQVKTADLEISKQFLDVAKCFETATYTDKSAQVHLHHQLFAKLT